MRIAFGTTELEPIVPGGAGALIGELTHRLESAGTDVSIVLLTREIDSCMDERVSLVTPSEAEGWNLDFMDMSRGVAEGLAAVHRDDPLDLVEIQDFDGLAFWMLTHRRDLGFGDVPIVVRFHGPVDLQVEAVEASTWDLDVAAAMERESFRMADAVVVPSDPIGQLVTERYGVEPHRIRVGPPPVTAPASVERWHGGSGDLVVVGRLSEVKGSHDMVDAAIPILERHPDVHLTFIGADGWSASQNMSMKAAMQSMIPDALVDRVRFEGHLTRPEVARRICSASAVVAPSRFESFNLAVHEARQLGAPVVVPDLPAFNGLVDADTGAVVYDGSIDGLADALEHVISNPTSIAQLAERPAPPVGDSLAPYRSPVAVRHERSQGGLGTAALARVEASRYPDGRKGHSDGAMGRLARRLPPTLVRMLRPLVPGSVRERARGATDWDRIVADREFEERWASAREMRGDRTGSDPPRTTFIVPCFNQGEFVRAAVLSMAEQTDQDWGAIIVDDGSDDGVTPGLLDELDMPGVEVIHQSNSGLPAARNRGIERCESEYVVPLDADDEVEPTFLERLRAELEGRPDAGYAHCWARLFGDFDAVWATRRVNPYQLLVSNSVVGCVLLRRAAWSRAGGYDESMRSGNEDWDLWLRLGALGMHGVQVREPLFRYRKHGVSMSVETESDYENVLGDQVRRLPGIYAMERVEQLKQNWYPLITIVADRADPVGGAVPSDAQYLTAGDASLATQIASIRGKYVTYLDHPSAVPAPVIRHMCDMLEDDDALGSVSSAGPSPVRVVRSWSLFDPDAPAKDRIVDVDARSTRRFEVHQFPRDEWIVPDEIAGVPVQRQHPEDPGTIPEWMRQA